MNERIPEAGKTMTQTPETDAMLDENGIRCHCSDKPVELCRKLETQRDEARRERDALMSIVTSINQKIEVATTGVEVIIADRDKWREVATKLAHELKRLRDCDWVISLPDRMDAVRKIAREALARFEEAGK